MRGDCSYQATHDLRLHFGLGQAQTVKTLTVKWPNGESQKFENVLPNRHYKLRERGALE